MRPLNIFSTCETTFSLASRFSVRFTRSSGGTCTMRSSRAASKATW